MTPAINFPQIGGGRKVYIVGGATADEETIFTNRGFEIAKSAPSADIFVWTGGQDIHPMLYGELPMQSTHWTQRRDEYEVFMYQIAQSMNKPKLGICRGGQLLNVLSGGKLWQHVDNHGGRVHPVFDPRTKFETVINSVHHQMMRPPKDAIVCGVARESTFHEGEVLIERNINKAGNDDIECVWIPRTQSLCFQAHPEYGHPLTTAFFFKLVEEFLPYQPKLIQDHSVHN